MALLILNLMAITSQSQSSISARLKAEIVTPITVVETEQLNFGKIISSAEGGIVQISPKSERVATGNLRMVDEQFSAGKFIVTGTPNSLIAILLPQTPQKMYFNKGNMEMTVSQFVCDLPVGGQVARLTDGRIDVSIGASLYIGNWSNNPSGFYTGTYEVVFLYN